MVVFFYMKFICFRIYSLEDLMKVSTLKFKELFNKTHQQIIHHQNQLNNPHYMRNQSAMKNSFASTNHSYFSEQNNLCKTQKIRPQTARVSRSSLNNNSGVTVRNQLGICHKYIKKDITKDHSYLINTQFIKIAKKDIINCLKTRNESQISEFHKQFAQLKNFLQGINKLRDLYTVRQLFDNLENSINHKFQHRIVRLVYYFIHNKFLEFHRSEENLNTQMKIWKLCEYYSRHMCLTALTLQICKRILQIMITLKFYDDARLYARKCLRIAVYIQDKASEFQIIQKFKIISYFEGVLNKYTGISISEQQRCIIMKTFKLLDDQPYIRGLSVNQQDKNRPQIAFDAEYIGNNQSLQNVSENVILFIQNLTQIRKQLTDHSQNIKSTMKKVSSIGKVNKYFKDGNYITLQPRSRNISENNQSQILMTHLARHASVQNKTNKYFRDYLPKYICLVYELISFCSHSEASIKKDANIKRRRHHFQYKINSVKL